MIQTPRGWRVVPLSEVASPEPNAIVDGPFGSNLKLSDYVDDGVPVLQGKNITGNTFQWFDVRFVSPEKADSLKRSLVKVGDILIVKIGSIGYSAILDDLHGYPCALIPANLCKVTPDLSTVDRGYLAYYLTAKESVGYLEANASATSQPALSLKKIKKLPVLLPPLPEQKRIADILAKADRLRRLRRYARELSDGYLQSVFLEMFGDPVTNPMGWEEGAVGDVVASSQYGTSKRSNSKQRGYAILGMGNITYSGRIDLKSLSHVDLSEEEFADLRLQAGDIIFNRTNSTELVGKTAHWNLDRDAVLASYLVKLRLKENVLPDYFTALLNTEFYKRLFQERCKKAVGQSNISPTLLKEFPMLMPPLDTQHAFVAIVQELERLRGQQREAERQAGHLFQTLLHRAFRGEV